MGNLNHLCLLGGQRTYSCSSGTFIPWNYIDYMQFLSERKKIKEKKKKGKKDFKKKEKRKKEKKTNKFSCVSIEQWKQMVTLT